jgi:hypothetical protein
MTDDRDTERLTDRAEPARELADPDFAPEADPLRDPESVPEADLLHDPDETRPIPLAATESLAGPGPVAVAPLDRTRRINTESEWFWPLVTLAGVAVVALVTCLANAFPFNDLTTADVADDVADQGRVWLQPAAWAYATWLAVLALLAGFAIFGLLRPGRTNPWVQRISPLVLVANVASVAWLFLWHWERFTASLVAIVVLLLAVIGSYVILHWQRKDEREASRSERIFAWPAFSIALGWAGVVTLINAMVVMERQGWDGGLFSLRWWAVLMLVAGGLASAVFAFVRRDGWVPLVFAIASFAIAAEQWDHSSLVSIAAIVIGVIAAILAVIGVMMAFDRRAMMGMYSTKRNESESTPWTP